MLDHLILRRSFYPPFVGFQQGDEVRHFPQAVRDTSSHHGSDPQRTVDLHEVV